MSGATLESLQRALARIYDLPGTPDVSHFLLTEPSAFAGLATLRATDEQLILAQDGDELSMALYIDAQVLERLALQDPHTALTSHNIADYLTAAEGVSHFVCVAWNAGHDRQVTLLELELQAEIDKYVLCAWLLREQGGGRFPRELHRVLFERARVDPVAAGDRASLYRMASDYAGRFCRHLARSLERKAESATRELLTELRRFYRLSNACKLAYIERRT